MDTNSSEGLIPSPGLERGRQPGAVRAISFVFCSFGTILPNVRKESFVFVIVTETNVCSRMDTVDGPPHEGLRNRGTCRPNQPAR